MLTYKEIQVLSQLIQAVEQASSKLEASLNSKNIEDTEKTKQLVVVLQKQIKQAILEIKK